MWLNNFHHFLFLFRIQEGIVLLEFTLPTSRLHGILVLHPHHALCPSFSVFPHLQNKGIAPNIYSCCTPLPSTSLPPSSPFCFPSSQRRGIKSGREGAQGTVIWKENEERNGTGSTRRQGTSEKVLAGLWVLELLGWTVMALLWCLRHPLTLVWDSQGVSPLCEYCSGLQGDSSCWLSATIPLPAVPWKISACSHTGTPVLACTHWYRLSLYEAH